MCADIEHVTAAAAADKRIAVDIADAAAGQQPVCLCNQQLVLIAVDSWKCRTHSSTPANGRAGTGTTDNG